MVCLSSLCPTLTHFFRRKFPADLCVDLLCGHDGRRYGRPVHPQCPAKAVRESPRSPSSVGVPDTWRDVERTSGLLIVYWHNFSMPRIAPGDQWLDPDQTLDANFFL